MYGTLQRINHYHYKFKANLSKIYGPLHTSKSFKFLLARANKKKCKELPKTIQIRTLDIGGGNNNGGKNVGGGGGGRGDGHDDSYFDFNEEDDQSHNHDGWFRRAFPQNYDRMAIQAVVDEWMRTVRGSPSWLHRIVVLGLLSTQHLVRLFTIDTKPNFLRNISRVIPRKLQSELLSRLIADPAFLNKLAVEQILRLVGTLHFEISRKRNGFVEGIDILIINLLLSGIANILLMWKTAPSRPLISTNPLPFQMIFGCLPNNIFDSSTKETRYNWTARGLSLFLKTVELSIIGGFFGIMTCILRNLTVTVRLIYDNKPDLLLHVPTLYTSIIDHTYLLGVHSGLRYQLLNGIDHWAFDRIQILPVYMSFSILIRLLNFLVERYGGTI